MTNYLKKLIQAYDLAENFSENDYVLNVFIKKVKLDYEKHQLDDDEYDNLIFVSNKVKEYNKVLKKFTDMKTSVRNMLIKQIRSRVKEEEIIKKIEDECDPIQEIPDFFKKTFEDK